MSGSKLGLVFAWCVDRSVWLSVWIGASQALCAPEKGPVRVREEWKMFEVKIWAENHFRWFWLILRSN